MIVDREDMERKLAGIRAAHQAKVNEPGVTGRRARVALATAPLDDWYADEIARGSNHAEIATVLVSRLGEIAGVMLGSFRATAPEGVKPTQEVRASLAQLLEISINRTLSTMDGLSTEELAGHSYAIHQEH